MSASSDSRVSVLIPAFNESDRIAATLAGCQELAGLREVIVVDDASTDDTGAVARASGADQVICLPENRGKAGALDAGLSAAQGRYILMLDADLGASSHLANALLTPILDGEADMTVAVFPELVEKPKGVRSKGGFGFALKLARSGIRALTGAQLVAPLSGQRCLDRRIVETMGGFVSQGGGGRGFGVETALSGWAAAGGWRVREIPVEMSHRRTGKNLSGLLHRLRQLAHISRALVWLAGARRRAHVLREAQQ
ncbi:MAG: glycosyltransferase family 2 protein [Armatimonadetes bacterium]|nr:glycosyltransferase family 2 protein [Armatimonadota bacterium]